MYLPGGPGVEARIRAIKAAEVRVEMPLPLVWVLLTSSSLPVRGERLRQARGPVIYLAGLIDSKDKL